MDGKLRRSLLFLIPFLALTTCQLHAEANCPWLTAGTVATFGEDVSVTVRSTSLQDGSCVFSFRNGTTEYSLEVEVGSTPGATCPSASPKVPGVGTEALSCRIRKAPDETADMITGRVRTLYFSIRLTSKGAAESSIPPDKRSEILEHVAEQVTGNLF
jgi:hypothetical protein